MKYIVATILFSFTIYAHAETTVTNTQIAGSPTIIQVSDASIEELFVAIQLQKIIQSANDETIAEIDLQLAEAVKEALQGQFMTEADLKISKEAQTKLHALLSPAIIWGKLQPIMKDSYRQIFNQTEMDTLIAFYKSAAGQALIEKEISLSKDIEALQSAQMEITDLNPLFLEIFTNTKATIEANHSK